ncbi:putative quinol monooxygenase [Arthrobacter sp. EH-1B-1]|uniref:Quinol monooxygenase n=1 Tax=Arthrobacter vasquezii TaxID=2977629 RepID=A0ABT6CXE4_9MICC|nr:putative quinol monooxygenase [Arthrobacter vasquezii]MDF9277724.1 putative quinol monooxygenase [Arthrobacter vasquezii]
MTAGDDFAAPVALYAEFTAKPGCSEAVKALLAELARKVQREPGNLVFDPHQEEANTDKFFVYEVYRDASAFQTHLSADYGSVFNAKLTELIIEDGSVLTYLLPLDLHS